MLDPLKSKGITVADVLAVFPGARIVPRKSEAEMWLEAQGVPQAHRQAILEEAARWVLEGGRWQRAETHEPRHCEHCSKSKELEDVPAWRRNGKIVKRIWSAIKWDWYCSFCGHGVKQYPLPSAKNGGTSPKADS